MEYTETLIDRAKELCGGSIYRLCKETGIDQGNMSKIRKGERKLTLKQTIRLCEIAGVEPKEAWYYVSLESLPEGSEERDLMGKAWGAIAPVMLLIFVSLALGWPSSSYAISTNGAAKLTKIYIVEYGRRCWKALRRFAFQGAQLLPRLAT